MSGLGDLPGTEWLSLAFAPRRVLFLLQPHSLITIEINAQVGGFVVRESEPKRLNSFSIRGQNNEVSLGKVQTINLYTLFVWPEDGFSLINA